MQILTTSHWDGGLACLPVTGWKKGLWPTGTYRRRSCRQSKKYVRRTYLQVCEEHLTSLPRASLSGPVYFRAVQCYGMQYAMGGKAKNGTWAPVCYRALEYWRMAPLPSCCSDEFRQLE